MKAYKRVVSCLLVLLFITAFLTSSVVAESPKAISNYEELCGISKDLEGDYYLTNDIVAPRGSTFATLGSSTKIFSGSFDGKGYSIKGLNIVPSNSGEANYSGLFASSKGTIKNLYITEASLSSSGGNWSYAGLITGVNKGLIENCFVSGKVENKNVGIAVYSGGICGKLSFGEVKNCVSYANVYSSVGEQYTGGISGHVENSKISESAVFGSLFANGNDATMDSYIGGISGRVTTSSEIKNCLYNGGLIAEKCANSYLGGICGQTKSKVEKCVALGAVSPSEIISHTYIGGIVSDRSSTDIFDSYYLENIITEEITGKFGTSLKKDEISSVSSFSALDFSSVWSSKNGVLSLKNLPAAPVTAPESKLLSIKISSKPSKLSYIQGDSSLDLRGLVVKAVYTDGEIVLEQKNYTVSGYNYIVAGKQTITVSFMGFTDSFTITVEETKDTIIGPAEVTEGAYSEGTANGVVANKKPSSSLNTSSKSKDSSKTTSTDSNLSAIGGNVVKDNLDDESEISSSDDATSSIASANKEKKDLNGLYITFGAIAFLLIAVFVTVTIIKKKSQKSDSEISNKEVVEVAHDENDIY